MLRTILIVDDVKSNREILKNILGNEYQIMEAAHGEEALTLIAAHHQQLSVILLDLGMPVMDGYEVLTRIQQDEVLSQLPIIVTTGQTDADSEEKALKLGAKDYLSKPYKSAIIKQRIYNTIRLRETAAAVNALQKDRLTGLLSRDAFFEKVHELTQSKQPGYYVMACFDVDKFKVINDQYGTEKGDEVLKHIAHTFLHGFEPHGGICCRVSADDFAVLYPADFQNSTEIAEIRRQASIVPGLSTTLAFSIGRYVIFDLNISPSAMYDRAMLAADSVKGRYDAQIACYDESMRDHLLHEQEIVTEMASALNTNQFEVWYQPQFNHSTKAMIGAEALVRWRHPEKGLIPPSVFIPVFEQNGFIYSLDRYVWEKACQYLRKELDVGHTPLPVSVNISRYDVFRVDFFAFITGLIEQYQLSVSLLRLEITESAFAESTDHIVEIVKQLINYGFTLEIDDFGSGYSSLNTLKNVPAQVVKLDMRFLEDDDDAQRGGNILESIVRMTKWLGMSVIAEGVEKKAQADYLRSIGCNYMQGYFYAKPIPEEAYRQLCADTKKEEKLLALETVENLDNNSFWSPQSIDSLIFNSYVGASCVYEYHQGKIELLRTSKKYAQILSDAGMCMEDALKLDWISYLQEESRIRMLSDLDRSIKTKTEITGEYVYVGFNDDYHELYLRSTFRVIASSGNRYLVYSTNENITAQRQAEQREKQIAEQLKTVLDNVACGITAVELQQDTVHYLLTNDRYYQLLGYTKQQYETEIGTQAFRTIYPEDQTKMHDTVNQVTRTMQPVTVEYRAVRRDQSVIWLRSLISMAHFESSSAHVQLSTYTDITQQKQAELELLDSTAQLSTMMDDIPGGFCRIRVFPDGRLLPVFINEGLCKLTGMSHDTMMDVYANDALIGVHPDDIAIVRKAIAQMLLNGEAHSTRYRLLHQQNGYVWLSIFGRITKNASDDTFLNIYYQDASNEMKLEMQQKELLDHLPYGAALYEYDGTRLAIVHLNKRYWELVGRTEKAYTGSSFLDAVHPDDRLMIINTVQDAIRNVHDVSIDLRIIHGENDYQPFHVVGRILPKENGRYAIYAVYTPISKEQMSIQEMLPIALSTVMDYQSEYTFVKDRNLRYICCSRVAAEMVQLSSSLEIQGKSDYELFDKETADRFVADDSKVMESGMPVFETPLHLTFADGSEHYVTTSKFPLKDAQGNVVGVYGIGRDVTEVRQMESRLQLLTNNIPGGLAVYEGTLDALDKIKLTYFSDGFCKLFGYTRAEFEKRAAINPLGSVAAEDIHNLYENIIALVQNQIPLDYRYRAIVKDNAVKWINVKAVMGEPNGHNLTVNAVFFDVTEHQEALEQLRISEEENRLAMQHTHNAVCRYDIIQRTLRLPQRVQKDYELPVVLENMPYSQLERHVISPETIDVYTQFYEEIQKGNDSGAAVYQRRSKEGWRWLEAHYSTIYSADNKPVSAVLSFMDITEQLEKDSAYKRWQQSFLNKAVDSYSLFRCNISKKSNYYAREGNLLSIQFSNMEQSFDQNTLEYMEQYVLEEDCERFQAFLNADALLSGYYQGKRIVTMEYRQKEPDGDIRWLKLTVDLVEHAHFADIEAYLLFEDIDKVKRMELATIELAETDPLTGVMNRVTFAAQVNNLLANSKPNTQYALMMLDIDDFKQVNDVFGHGAGDQTLIDIVSCLRTALRHDDLIGRLGGDEFVIFLNEIPNDVIAAKKAKQICALVRKSFSIEVEISASIGIAMIPRDGNDFDALYRKVDAALYHVKGAGKNDFAFYQQDMKEATLRAKPELPIEETSRPKKKRRMLIVDDSKVDHALLSGIFEQQFLIEKANDGNTALARLRHYGSAISVVLLDLIMPGMNGFAVLKRMQESAELRNVPVVVVSGDDNRETGLQAIREGAADYVSKPVDPDLLRIRVQSAISKAENERLRAKNSFLEYQNSMIIRYQTALEHSGIVVVEHDWIAGQFQYDNSISQSLAGTYDQRGLWHILLSDFVADTTTVKKMQEMVHALATDHERTEEKLFAQLKTPTGDMHWFRISIYKLINEFGIAGRIYLTFADIGHERPS